MKKFNQMTERQMDKVHGGFASLLIAGVTLVLGPLALGASIGYGTYTATQQVKNKG